MIRFLLPVLGLTLLSFAAKSEDPTDSLLTVLRMEIGKKKSYDLQMDRRITQLKQALTASAPDDCSSRYALLDRLYTVYRGYNFDSAYAIVVQLLAVSEKMHDLSKEYVSRIRVGEIELESCRIKEAFDCLARIDVQKLDREVKMRYYELKTRAYSDLDTYNKSEFHSDSNRKQTLIALDSALLLSDSGSFERDKHIAEIFNLHGQTDKAVNQYQQLLARNTITDNQRARTGYDLSQLTDETHSIRLLLQSVTCDIRSSVNRTLAAPALGKLLFKRGDLEDAKLVLQLGVDQATAYGPILRAIEIETNLNRVAAQLLVASEDKKNRTLTLLLSILVLAIAATVFIAFKTYHRLELVKQRELRVQQRNRRLDKLNKRLLEDAGIKEEYIGYFFNLVSSYIARLEGIKRNVEHNFRIKNYDEVLKMAHEIDLKHERHELFYTFDKIFLKLFPNFITTFNSLLRTEEQIWPKHNEALNTSLRIFALMRLGIQDNRTIAGILETSVSTIYTYKARIRSKALVPGEEFDNKIMEIQFVDFELAEPVE